MIDRVAGGIFKEVKVTRRCPIQCFTTCAVLAIMNCANSMGSLQPTHLPAGNDEAAEDAGVSTSTRPTPCSAVLHRK